MSQNFVPVNFILVMLELPFTADKSSIQDVEFNMFLAPYTRSYFHNVGYCHILYIFQTFTLKFASKKLDLVIMTYHLLCKCEIISHELIVFHSLVLTTRA